MPKAFIQFFVFPSLFPFSKMGPWSLIEVESANQNRPLPGNFEEQSNWNKGFGPSANWVVQVLSNWVHSFDHVFKSAHFYCFFILVCHFQYFLLPGSESPYLEVGLFLTWRKNFNLVHGWYSWELFQECWRSFRIWKIWTFLQIWNARKNDWNGWNFNCFFHVWKFKLSLFNSHCVFEIDCHIAIYVHQITILELIETLKLYHIWCLLRTLNSIILFSKWIYLC